MKIMDITIYYHKYSGGIKTYINEKVKWLSEKKIDHVVVIPGKVYKKYKVRNSTFYELPSLILLGGYRYFLDLKDIENIIHLEKPDILELGGTYYIFYFLKKSNFFLAAFYHSDVLREIELLQLPKILKKKILNFLLEKCLKKADLLLVPSTRYQEELKQLGFKQIMRAPLGVDVKLFNPYKMDINLKKSFGIPPQKFLLLYVGRLSPEKGIKLLLEAFQRLDPTKYHLFIVGKGPLEFLIKIYQNKLSNLTHLPYLGVREDLAKLYASSDLFVSASSFETFGLSFLEAQASGLPVCAFDLGLETQIIKEILAREKTPESLTNNIVKACHLVNPELRNYLHKKVQENFSWDKTFASLLEAYGV